VIDVVVQPWFTVDETMKGNDIGSDGALCFGKGLKNNQTLASLNLAGAALFKHNSSSQEIFDDEN